MEIGFMTNSIPAGPLGRFSGAGKAALSASAGAGENSANGIPAALSQGQDAGFPPVAPGQRNQEADGNPTSGQDGRKGRRDGFEDPMDKSGKCATCENRRYQDGSDDSSVSFQAPTKLAPGAVATAVQSHEMEHVTHEKAKAVQENRKIVYQHVQIHTAACPECGRIYVSGGTTRTMTKGEQAASAYQQAPGQEDSSPVGNSFDATA